jgi:hypothetical protein
MHIDFEFSGGYANLRFKYHANTDELPKEIAGELLKHVESSKALEIQQKDVSPGPSGPPDVFFYRLYLQEGSRRISLSFNDVTAPVTLHPLLAFLRKLAMEQAGKG